MWEGGGMNTFQRSLDIENVGRIIGWWSQDTTVSPNAPIAWLPADLPPFQEQANNPASMLTLNPQLWCVQQCVCGATSDQYEGHDDGMWFDNCRQCENPPLRPGYLIDGQHRTRAMAQPGTGHNEQKIFCSMVSTQNPLGVSLEDAARIFIEVNGGAAPLNQLQEDFLASHFRILNYDDTQRRAAFAIAARLNAPAMSHWALDNGQQPRTGRITMMPGGATMDYLPSWRIEDIVLRRMMGNEVPVPAIGGGVSHRTPMTWNPIPDNSVAVISQLLRDYLQAVTDTWTGAGNVARVMPAWCTNRSQRGNMQRTGVMRVMLRLLPSILARIEEQGDVFSTANMSRELELIANVTFDDNWGTFMHGDTGLDRMERVLEMILRTTPYQTPAPAWPGIEQWAFGEHDTIQIVNPSASSHVVSFSTETTCSQDPAIVTRASLVGSKSALVTITNTHTGASEFWDGFRTGEVAMQSVSFADLGMANATPGQDIEINIQIKTSMNQTSVQSTPVTVTVV
tara:strand:+ start:1413 stop:2945 length:1533 start_codon:yes stop_codon:yes gene_type:complete